MIQSPSRSIAGCVMTPSSSRHDSQQFTGRHAHLLTDAFDSTRQPTSCLLPPPSIGRDGFVFEGQRNTDCDTPAFINPADQQASGSEQQPARVYSMSAVVEPRSLSCSSSKSAVQKSSIAGPKSSSRYRVSKAKGRL